MFSIATKMAGMAQGVPDVCKVPAPPAPPVPTPFPNIANLPMANPGTCTKLVKIMNMPVVTVATQVPLSSGDEAGVAGGLVSGVNMNACTFKMGSIKLYIEGNAAITQLKTSGHNGSNANQPMGMVASPSQPLVKVSS
ncbi:MAG: PAAR-like domain-containing protein [Myxococcota bacterium]